MCSCWCVPVWRVNQKSSNESSLYAEAIRQVRRSPMCQGIQSVYFYSTVSIHHIAAWFPDQLKVSLRWFFFKDINHECLLVTHDLLILGFSIYFRKEDSPCAWSNTYTWSLWTPETPPIPLLIALMRRNDCRTCTFGEKCCYCVLKTGNTVIYVCKTENCVKHKKTKQKETHSTFYGWI